MDNKKTGTFFITTGSGKSGYLKQLLEKNPEQFLNIVNINFDDSKSEDN